MTPVLVGLLAAALFSSTFVLNATVATHGGHWYWAGALRYLWTGAILGAYVLLRYGKKGLQELLRIAIVDWPVVGLATVSGVLLFYAPLCYAGARAPAWIVACTWQSTVLFSPMILAFGFRYWIPGSVFVWASLTILGVFFANGFSEAETRTAGGGWVTCVVLVMLAAMAYPVGNQVLYECVRGTIGGARWSETVAAHAAARVCLVSLCSLPGWLVLGVLVRPPAPVWVDWWRTLIVSVSSGVLATSLFYAARSRARNPAMVAAVDATQAMEVVFAMTGDVLVLGNGLPGVWGGAGVVITCAGVIGAARVAGRA